ncbi:hypothetical protein AAZX31_10G075300 [Glycine max]
MPQSESLVVSETAMQNVFMVRWILKTCWALAMVMKEGFGKVSIQQKVLCAVNVLHGIWLPFCFLQWLVSFVLLFFCSFNSLRLNRCAS